MGRRWPGAPEGARVSFCLKKRLWFIPGALWVPQKIVILNVGKENVKKPEEKTSNTLGANLLDFTGSQDGPLGLPNIQCRKIKREKTGGKNEQKVRGQFYLILQGPKMALWVSQKFGFKSADKENVTKTG